MNSKSRRFLKYLKQLKLDSGEATPIQNPTASSNSPLPSGSKKEQPHFEVMDITPDMAKKILTFRNRNNRGIKYTNLARLVQAIENGEWKVTNQGIAFDKEGNLIDGQHRLAAVLQTRKTVKMMVATNMDARIFDVVDTGTRRTAGDALDILGSSDGRTISAALKIYYAYHKYPDRTWSNTLDFPSSVEIAESYEKRKVEIEALLSVIKKKHSNFKCFTPSSALCLTLLCIDAGWSDIQMWEFWDAVTLGANLQADSVVLSFRNQLTNPDFRKRGYGNQRYILNAFIKCFNFYVQQVPMEKFMAPFKDTKMYKVQKPIKKESSILEVIKK